MKKILNTAICLSISAIALSMSVGAMSAPVGGVEVAGDDDKKVISTKELPFNDVVELVDELGYYTADDSIYELYLAKLLAENPNEYYQLMNDIVSSHDDKSMFLSPAQYTSGFSTDNTFKGIGIAFTRAPNGLLVREVITGSPAKEAGIKLGDVITQINGIATLPLSTEGAKSALTADSDEEIVITVQRGEERLKFTFARGEIDASSVVYDQIGDQIMYIKINSFGSDTYDEFKKQWDIVEEEDLAVILDLRGNPGGDLAVTAEIIDDMIEDKNKTFMTLDKRDDYSGDDVYKTSGTGYEAKELVILVDDDSASASEVVAGALDGLELATLIGEKTYGKGTGQYHIEVGGGMLVITGMKIELPKHGFYDGDGIIPDVEVKNENIKFALPELTPIDLTTELYLSNVSDKTKALEERLVLLGYMDYADKTFTQETITAINEVQRAYNLAEKPYATQETLRVINNLIENSIGKVYYVDNQLNKAIETINNLLGDDNNDTAA